MPCFHPIDAWYGESRTGKLIFSYNAKTCDSVQPHLRIPCGRCSGCRLERSRQWACRIMNEASLHSHNCFITLTYAPEHLPEDRSLDYRHFQLFMKRLRKRFSGVNIRFYMCGEYGEEKGRPHFHACLFGIKFDDLTRWKEVKYPGGRTETLYRSKTLESLWTDGHSSVGTVTFNSAAYVARYIMKKQTGDGADQHYSFCPSFNRGDIRSPSRVQQVLLETGDWPRLDIEIYDGCVSVRPAGGEREALQASPLLRSDL